MKRVFIAACMLARMLSAQDWANGLEGDETNVHWVRGDFGKAARFTGTQSFIDVTSIGELKACSAFSYAGWILWDALPKQYPNLLTSVNWSPDGLMLFVNNGTCSFRMGDSSQQWRETSVPLCAAITTNTWFHLAVTFSQPIITTYLNGKKVATQTWDHPINANGWRVGNWFGQTSHSGLMRDVRLYTRALASHEIETLAATSHVAATAYTPIPNNTDEPPLAVFKTRHGSLSLLANGQVASLRVAGQEVLAAPRALVHAQLLDTTTVRAKSVTRKGNTYTFTLSRNAGHITLAVDEARDYLRFTVREVQVPNLKSLTFAQFQLVALPYAGQMLNMLSSDDLGVCLRGLDLPVEMACSGNLLRTSIDSPARATGCRAVLAFAPKARMQDVLQRVTRDNQMPCSSTGGAWAMGSEANRGSYLFADMTHTSTDDWIELAHRGGFNIIHIHGWWESLGHYAVRTNYFPNGLADMQDTVQRIHAAGLRAGIHTLTGCIETHDPWITPACREELIPWKSYTLARDFGPEDTTLYVTEKPIAAHDVVFTYSGNGNAIRLGKELIQYTEISREPPYAFKKCTRGAFKTKPSCYKAGEQADYLQQRYMAFYPQPDSKLAEELADCIANVYNSCALNQLYFDGSEGMMSRYGIDKMRHLIHNRLKGDNNETIHEASCYGAHNWWFHSKLGTWDHPVWGMKDFHDAHIASAARYRKSELLEPQMGWWAPRGPSSIARGHFLNEMEYFACKNLGLDSAMSIQGINVSSAPLPWYIEQQITLLGWYEHLRLARYFDAATLARIAQPGADFILRQEKQGNWQFTPVTYTIQRFANAISSLTVTNTEAAQPLSFRIEALFGVAPYTSANRIELLNGAAALTPATAQREITIAAQPVAGEHVPGQHLLLVATNRTAQARGAWACVTHAFDGPNYLNLKQNAGFGLWVKGDGQGALLNIQVQTPREYLHAISDHYVKLDFMGWRYIELLARERDVDKMLNFVWPYSHGGSHATYRTGLNLAHISQVSIYLNEIPAQGQTAVTLSPIMALPVEKRNVDQPQLTLNGQTLRLPLSLASGDFAELTPEGCLTHYRANGDVQARYPLKEQPTLQQGANPVSWTGGRAEITVAAYGQLFGSKNRRVDTTYMQREYAFSQWILEPQTRWDVCVRPDARAKLEVEITGELANPILTIGDTQYAFPVTLKRGERLLCRDQKSWTVVTAARTVIASGMLTKPLPRLASGTTSIGLTCENPQAAQVKLVKVYTR